MRKKRFLMMWASISLALILVALAFMGACAKPLPEAPAPTPEAPAPAPEAPAPAPVKPIELKLVTPMPSGAPLNVAPLRWAEEVEKRTQGRVKTTVYEGTLGKQPDFVDMLDKDICQIAYIGPGFYGELFSVMALDFVPFVAGSLAETMEVLWELHYKGLLKAQVEDQNYKFLYAAPTHPINVALAEKKVTCVDDFKGLKIRVAPAWVPYLTALGAVPVPMPPPDIYMSLDRGMIDGAMTSWSGFTSLKIFEVSKYFLWGSWFIGPFVVLTRADIWDSLPLDIQLIVERVNHEASIWHMDRFYEADLQFTPAAVEAYGWEVSYLSSEEKARLYKLFEPGTNDWIAKQEAKGLPGREVIELSRRVRARYE